MTFAIRLRIHSEAGHGLYVKLTPMGSVPYECTSRLSGNAIKNPKNHALAQLVHCYVLQSDVEPHRAFLGEAIPQHRLLIADFQRALNTLRYIHANPKAAGMQQGFFYDFSNYGTYDRLSNDGITQWHQAFFQLGRTLEECAARYRKFCQKYKPKAKPEKRNFWGSNFLPSILKGAKAKKSSPGHMSLPWDKQRVTESTEVHEVAEKFIHAPGI